MIAERRTIGTIEVYASDAGDGDGVCRSIPIMEGQMIANAIRSGDGKLEDVLVGNKILHAALEAHDIWEEAGQRIGVKVMRNMGNGEQKCICHLPPIEVV